MELFPAILIGGPPHMGKSVLTYSLTHALRERGVQHYVIRAYPDGEGDWANEADQRLVRRIRIKGYGTSTWVDRMCRDIEARHLPLLVDVGGRPTPDQERIFDHCTHAILLTGDERAHKLWQTMIARHGLLTVADLRSQLDGEPSLSATHPVVRGLITGLERGTRAMGPIFDLLVERVARLFDYPADELRRAHLISAPVETTVDLDRLARTFSVPFLGEKAIWEPHHLTEILSYLPEAIPLGLYGRAPNWLYVAVALLTSPAAFYQFDPRLGWIEPPRLRLGKVPEDSPLQVHLFRHGDYFHLDFYLPDAYLDYADAEALPIPPLPPGYGVVLGGKVPHWLYTALALAYRAAPWIAVYQPQLGRAVVVQTVLKSMNVGELVAVEAPSAG